MGYSTFTLYNTRGRQSQTWSMKSSRDQHHSRLFIRGESDETQNVAGCCSKRRVWLILWAAAGTLYVFACQATADLVGAGNEHDSAGVVIVDDLEPRLDSGTAWSVEASPEVEISGSARSGGLFSQILTSMRFRDGTIAVLEHSDVSIRFFSKSGEFRNSVGGRGSGPGEFFMMDMAAPVGPRSMLVADRDGRITLFRSSGTVEKTAKPAGVAYVLAIFSDATLLIDDYRPTSGTPGFSSTPGVTSGLLDSMDIGLIDISGERTHRIGKVPEAPPRSSSYPIPFGPRTHLATVGERFFSGYSARWRIDLLSRDGKLVRSIRRPWTPTPIGTEEVTRAYQSLIQSDRPEPYIRRMLEEKAGRREAPGFFPAFAQMLVSRDGLLWVRRYAGSEDWFQLMFGLSGASAPQAIWDVFAENGEWVVTVKTPDGLVVQEIGSDYVLGYALDSLGVPSVRLHRLVKKQ
jgi:hypothetical protein